jgi:hypothetical protein
VLNRCQPLVLADDLAAAIAQAATNAKAKSGKHQVLMKLPGNILDWVKKQFEKKED